MADGMRDALVSILIFGAGVVAGILLDKVMFQRAVLLVRDELGRVYAVQGTYKQVKVS